MKTIEEGNKLIAEFMGARRTTFSGGIEGHTYWHEDDNVAGRSGHFPNGATNYADYSQGYNTSWDWLMAVIKNIDSIANEVMSFEEFDNYRTQFAMIDKPSKFSIEDVHKQVVEFIEGYKG